MTKLGIYAPCGWGALVQLEMIGTVPEVAPGERVTWSTAGKQRFIYREISEVDAEDIIEDPQGFEFPSSKITAYHATPGFDLSPYAVQFHRPEPHAICLLENVLHQGIDQIIQTSHGLEIFGLCSYGALAINWPTFNQENPLTLHFHNPMDCPLLSFHLSLDVTVPKDFAERWIEEGV